MLETEHRTTSDAIRKRLAQQVRAMLGGRNGHRALQGSVARASIGLPRLNPFAWLQAQKIPTRLFWSARRGAEEVAGVGEADCCTARAPADLALLRRHLSPMLAACGAEVRYYGGLRFDQAPPHEEAWRAFGAYWFVLPRFELRTTKEGSLLICNLAPPRDMARIDEVLSEIDRLRFPIGGLALGVPAPCARSDRPDTDGWREMIAWALEAFVDDALDKVVFARETSFEFADDFNPIALLERLKAGTPSCFHFCVQPGDAPAFVGASPERLFRRYGRCVESEAVAGTRPRGASATDDARLLDELLHSEKERREHEYVRISLREELAPLVDTLRLDAQPSELKLATQRHLVSRLKATLRPGMTSLDVLAALHPTPAVGGYPSQRAMRAIRALEPFDRGWYAGPVGWIGPDAAEFAVGIRSGLVQRRRLSLYSGAGIVEGSTPEAEWDEIEHKIGDFTRVLGLNTRPMPAARPCT